MHNRVKFLGMTQDSQMSVDNLMMNYPLVKNKHSNHINKDLTQ